MTFTQNCYQAFREVQLENYLLTYYHYNFVEYPQSIELAKYWPKLLHYFKDEIYDILKHQWFLIGQQCAQYEYLKNTISALEIRLPKRTQHACSTVDCPWSFVFLRSAMLLLLCSSPSSPLLLFMSALVLLHLRLRLHLLPDTPPGLVSTLRCQQ
jgi:hypothetical protein